MAVALHRALRPPQGTSRALRSRPSTPSPADHAARPARGAPPRYLTRRSSAPESRSGVPERAIKCAGVTDQMPPERAIKSRRNGDQVRPENARGPGTGGRHVGRALRGGEYTGASRAPRWIGAFFDELPGMVGPDTIAVPNEPGARARRGPRWPPEGARHRAVPKAPRAAAVGPAHHVYAKKAWQPSRKTQRSPARS